MAGTFDSSKRGKVVDAIRRRSEQVTTIMENNLTQAQINAFEGFILSRPDRELLNIRRSILDQLRAMNLAEDDPEVVELQAKIAALEPNQE